MECITIEKAAFTVVGKLAEVCGEMESGWAQALWGEANLAYFPERGYSLAGAIQEYYDPGEREGVLYLCAPIGRLE